MAEPPPDGEAPAVRTLGVLLGASNLTLALTVAVREGLRRLERSGPSLLVAHGPGRSYGIEAGVAGFRFAGLSACAIGDCIDQARGSGGEPSGWALLTDVGNDICYGREVDEILGWIAHLVDSLCSRNLVVGVTSLPLGSILRISALKFEILRRLLFPFHPISRQEVFMRARQVQEGLEHLTAARGTRLLPVRQEWYGADHIHLRRACRGEAFRAWLDEIAPCEAPGDDPAGVAGLPANGPVRRALRRRTLRPVEWRWIGRRFPDAPKTLLLPSRARLLAL